ncbi:MAG: hypothetical protein Q9192_005457 [Flavoplaca navasiana]
MELDNSGATSDASLGSRGSPTPRGKKPRRRAGTADPNQKALALAQEYRLRQYKPTLVVAPSSGVIVWKQAKRDFPALKIKFWMGNKSSAKPKDRPDILGATNLALMQFLNEIPDTPQALLVVVVTTYSTWHLRTTYLEGPADRRRAKQAKVAEAAKAEVANKDVAEDGNKDVDEDGKKEVDEDDHGQDSDGESEDASMRRRTWVPGVFGRLMCDEAQKIKDPTTRSNRALRLLNAPNVTMMSGTPLMNTTEDMSGLLWLAWNKDWAIDSPKPIDEYSEARRDIEALQRTGKWTQDHVESYRWLLNPVAFAKFARLKDENNQMHVDIAHSVLPPLLMLLSLRRHGDTIINVKGKDVRIGEAIPNGKWLTVELGLTRDDSEQQVLVHEKLSARLSGGFNKEKEHGRRDHGIHRRLCHSALNPSLETLYTRVGQSKLAVSSMDKTYHEFNDHGASFYLQHTRPVASFPNYHHRGDLAKYICMFAPKLRMLAGLAHQICNVNRRKLLVFCDWPITQWNVEMLLCTLGFKVLSMRSAHSAAVRDECVEAFTTKGNIEENQILSTSTRIAATAVNLQGDCDDVLFLDIPNNAQTLLQAAARVLRMGQKNPCNFYIITADGTYDQSTQANQALKMRPIIAGQAGIADPTSFDCDCYRKVHPELANEDDNAIAAKIVSAATTELYTQLFGQRSSREDWYNPADRTDKNKLPAERDFRLRHQIPPLDIRLGLHGRPKKTAKKPQENTEASENTAVDLTEPFIGPLRPDSKERLESLQRRARQPKAKKAKLSGSVLGGQDKGEEAAEQPPQSTDDEEPLRHKAPHRTKLSESIVNSADDEDDDQQLSQSTDNEEQLRHKTPDGADISFALLSNPPAPTNESKEPKEPKEPGKPKAPARKRGGAGRKKRNPAGRFTSSKDSEDT